MRAVIHLRTAGNVASTEAIRATMTATVIAVFGGRNAKSLDVPAAITATKRSEIWLSAVMTWATATLAPASARCMP